MTTVPVGILVAILGGMSVGVEREWSGHASGPKARFAGIRTFTLLGGLAGIAGWLWTVDLRAFAVVLLAAGVMAGIGELAPASAVIALTSLFLVEKSRLHALVARLDDQGLRAAVRFAVMAVVILPLLPPGPFGPWDSVRPRELWMLVLLCSGLSFAAYIARRAVGDRHGYPIAGLLGGLISSTSVTLAFARTSRRAAPLAPSLALGVIAACTVLFVRVAIATLILNASVARALVIYLIAPFAVGALILLIKVRALSDTEETRETSRNPLDVWPALQMAAMFQLVLFAVELARRTWGQPGVIASGAVLGLTDIDALTISMARGALTSIPVDVAARAIAVGILANTALKLGLVLSIGVARFKTHAAPALVAMAAAIAGSMMLWR